MSPKKKMRSRRRRRRRRRSAIAGEGWGKGEKEKEVEDDQYEATSVTKWMAKLPSVSVTETVQRTVSVTFARGGQSTRL